MDINGLLLVLLRTLVILGIFKLLIALNNKRFVNENRNPFGPKRTIHFAIFQSRAALDLFLFVVMMNFSGFHKYLPEDLDIQTFSTNILIILFIFFTVNVSIRFLLNELNVKRGKPDILENYYSPDKP